MGKNVTEQQRIAAALESMVDASNDESTKKNVTEQQRIASALEAMAESGGGGEDEMCFVEFTESYDSSTDTTTYTFEKTYDEIHELCKNGKCLGAVRVLDDGGRITRTIYWLSDDSEYLGRIKFTNVDYGILGSEGHIGYTNINLLSNGEIQAEYGTLLTNVAN